MMGASKPEMGNRFAKKAIEIEREGKKYGPDWAVVDPDDWNLYRGAYLAIVCQYEHAALKQVAEGYRTARQIVIAANLLVAAGTEVLVPLAPEVVNGLITIAAIIIVSQSLALVREWWQLGQMGEEVDNFYHELVTARTMDFSNTRQRIIRRRKLLARGK